MAEKKGNVAKLFGPPPKEQQTNLMEPRTCIVGGACNCRDGGRGFRALSAQIQASDRFRADKNQEFNEELLTTKDPQRVLAIRTARLEAGVDCPRKPVLH